MYYVDDIEERIRVGKIDAETLKKDLKIVEKYSNCVASAHFFLDLKSAVGEPEKHHVLFTNLGDFRDVFSLYELVLFRRDLLKMRLLLPNGIVKDVVSFLIHTYCLQNNKKWIQMEKSHQTDEWNSYGELEKMYERKIGR